MPDKSLSLEVRKSIVKGQTTDYAVGVAINNGVSIQDLSILLKEISDSLKE